MQVQNKLDIPECENAIQMNFAISLRQNAIEILLDEG